MDSRFRKLYASLSSEKKALVQEEYKRAYDFDPKDPLFGLSRAELSGPKLSRRAMLRLLAASGFRRIAVAETTPGGSWGDAPCGGPRFRPIRDGTDGGLGRHPRSNNP